MRMPEATSTFLIPGSSRAAFINCTKGPWSVPNNLQIVGCTQLKRRQRDELRVRAGIPAVSGLSQTVFRDSVRLERRREFVFEGQRWFDLSRWGVLNSVITAKTTELGTIAPGETTVHGASSNLLPIPQGERNKNPNLTQNPGWN